MRPREMKSLTPRGTAMPAPAGSPSPWSAWQAAPQQSAPWRIPPEHLKQDLGPFQRVTLPGLPDLSNCSWTSCEAAAGTGCWKGEPATAHASPCTSAHSAAASRQPPLAATQLVGHDPTGCAGGRPGRHSQGSPGCASTQQLTHCPCSHFPARPRAWHTVGAQ